MFDKEAEEIANKRCHEIMCYGHCSFSSPKHHRCGEWHREYNCAKEGIEYGYNKANEWHYVKDGNLPKNNTQTLVLLENKRMKISIFMENKFTVWNKEYNTYAKLYNVIAWKEIVLPKESE